MSLVWHFDRPDIPVRAVFLSFGALMVPVLHTLFFNDPTTQPDALLWLLALVPAFLLAYYRGWRGAATALAAGMVALTLTHLSLLWRGEALGNWALLAGVTFAFAAISLAVGALSERLHTQRAFAEEVALTDDLTGLWNRRRARMFLEAEFEVVAENSDAMLAVVLFDLDKFKLYNDLNGHTAGDEALRAFARTLAACTRAPDLSCRYGGEEFLTVLSNCNAEGAASFVERFRRALRESSIGGVTACAGIASYEPYMSTPSQLLIAADQALYQAKLAGGDSVRVYRREPELRTG